MVLKPKLIGVGSVIVAIAILLPYQHWQTIYTHCFNRSVFDRLNHIVPISNCNDTVNAVLGTLLSLLPYWLPIFGAGILIMIFGAKEISILTLRKEPKPQT